MTVSQILQAIRLMPSIERLEILEYTLQLMREDLTRDSSSQAERSLSLAAAAEAMRDFYAEGSELTAFTDRSLDDFVEYDRYRC
jgi:hypothetical protein